MAEAPQSYTFREMTDAGIDGAPSYPPVVEYTMDREEAVSLLREASTLLATGESFRSHYIPTKNRARWLQAPVDAHPEGRGIEWVPPGAPLARQFFRLTRIKNEAYLELVGRQGDMDADDDVLSRITSIEVLRKTFNIQPDEERPRLYLVQGKDFVVPGLETRVCATEDAAKEHALDLVNDIRSSVGLAPALDASTFEEALQEAREARATQTGVPVESVELDEDCNAEVWIETVPLWAGAPPTLVNARKAAVETSGAPPEGPAAPRRRPR